MIGSLIKNYSILLLKSREHFPLSYIKSSADIFACIRHSF